MKCIKKNGKIRRVNNDLAHNLVDSDGYKFCSKQEWKEQKKKKNK